MKQMMTPNAGPWLKPPPSSPGRVSQRSRTMSAANPDRTTAISEEGNGSFGSFTPKAFAATTAKAASMRTAARTPAPNSHPMALSEPLVLGIPSSWPKSMSKSAEYHGRNVAIRAMSPEIRKPRSLVLRFLRLNPPDLAGRCWPNPGPPGPCWPYGAPPPWA